MLYSIHFHCLAVHLRSIFVYPILDYWTVTALYDCVIRAFKNQKKSAAKSATRQVAIPRLDVYGPSSQRQY
jgi:hypothetical protein